MGGRAGWGNKGKHLSNLQRAHWYVEWTLVCGLRLRLFQGKTISFLLDSRGLGKHYQPGDSAQCCHCYQLTPPSSPSLAHTENGRVLYVAGTAQSSSLWVYGGRQNIPGCPMFGWLVFMWRARYCYLCVLRDRWSPLKCLSFGIEGGGPKQTKKEREA